MITRCLRISSAGRRLAACLLIIAALPAAVFASLQNDAHASRSNLIDQLAQMERQLASSLKSDFTITSYHETDKALTSADFDALPEADKTIESSLHCRWSAWPDLLRFELTESLPSIESNSATNKPTIHWWDRQTSVMHDTDAGEIVVASKRPEGIDWSTILLFNQLHAAWGGSRIEGLSDLLRGHASDSVDQPEGNGGGQQVLRLELNAGAMAWEIHISDTHAPYPDRFVQEIRAGPGGRPVQRIEYRVIEWMNASTGLIPRILYREEQQFMFAASAGRASAFRRTAFSRLTAESTTGTQPRTLDWYEHSLRGTKVEDRRVQAFYEIGLDRVELDGSPFRTPSTMTDPQGLFSLGMLQLDTRTVSELSEGGGDAMFVRRSWLWACAALFLLVGLAAGGRGLLRREPGSIALGSLLLLFAGSACVLALQKNQPPEQVSHDASPAAATRELTILEGEHFHDFGSIPHPGRPVDMTHTFKLRNPSDKTLTVLRVNGSCSCTRVSASKDSIEPGEVLEVSVTISFREPNTLRGRVIINLGEDGVDIVRVLGRVVPSEQLWPIETTLVLDGGGNASMQLVAVGYERLGGPGEPSLKCPTGVSCRFDGWTQIHGSYPANETQPRWHGSVIVHAESIPTGRNFISVQQSGRSIAEVELLQPSHD